MDVPYPMLEHAWNRCDSGILFFNPSSKATLHNIAMEIHGFSAKLSAHGEFSICWCATPKWIQMGFVTLGVQLGLCT